MTMMMVIMLLMMMMMLRFKLHAHVMEFLSFSIKTLILKPSDANIGQSWSHLKGDWIGELRPKVDMLYH